MNQYKYISCSLQYRQELPSSKFTRGRVTAADSTLCWKYLRREYRLFTCLPPSRLGPHPPSPFCRSLASCHVWVIVSGRYLHPPWCIRQATVWVSIFSHSWLMNLGCTRKDLNKHKYKRYVRPSCRGCYKGTSVFKT